MWDPLNLIAVVIIVTVAIIAGRIAAGGWFWED